MTACEQVDQSIHLEQDFEFTTQVEINQFRETFPNCQSIKGDFKVEEAVKGSITDLSPFSNLKKIQGHVNINSNARLFTLIGLHHLDTIIGPFEIYRNPSLQELKLKNL